MHMKPLYIERMINGNFQAVPVRCDLNGCNQLAVVYLKVIADIDRNIETRENDFRYKSTQLALCLDCLEDIKAQEGDWCREVDHE